MLKRNKLHKELKDFIVNVGWTHKIHIVRSDEYSNYAKLFKMGRIFMSALTSSGIIGLFLADSFLLKLITAFCSFVTVAMNSIDKVVDYDKLSLKEKTDATNFWNLRVEAESLLNETVYNTKNLEEIENQLQELQNFRKQYNVGLLNVPQRTVNKACKMINERRDNDYSQDYIKFIAPELLTLKPEEDIHDNK